MNTMHSLLKFRTYFLLILAYLILIFISYKNSAYQLDDALIYQRYIQNFLAGHGLVYNPGELFNGLTSPLFSYLMVLAALVIGDAQIAAVLLSTLFMLGAISIFTLLFAKYEKLEWMSLGAVFTVCFSFYYYVYGMETPLFILLIGLCIYLFEKEQIFWLGIACALLLLTRSEGVFLILALAIEHFRQRRAFPKLTYFIIPFALIAAVYVFNYFYYGKFLPDTGMAKIYQGQSGLWGAFLDPLPPFIAAHYVEWFFSNNFWLFYLLLGSSLVGVIALWGASLNVILLAFLAFYSAFFLGFNIPGYHWYYGPYFIIALFYSALGFIWITKNLFKSDDKKFKALSAIGIASAIFLLTYQSVSQTITHRNFGKPIAHYKKIGLWLKENTPKDSKIAVLEIGHVGYYSERYIIDILGLVNPLNAKFVAGRDLNQWVKHYRPDYMVVHYPLANKEQGARVIALLSDMTTVDDFQLPNFKLLKINQLNNRIVPEKLHSEAGEKGLMLTAQGEHYVTLVHAPGYVQFNLEPGEYELSGEFGILQHAYANPDKATDGVNFRIYAQGIEEQGRVVYQRFLSPVNNLQDQGFQSFYLDNLSISTPSKLYFFTEPGESGNYDVSFWRNLQLKPLKATTLQ